MCVMLTAVWWPAVCRKQEIGQAVQKVKESHDQCSRRQDARLKDLDLLSQQLKEAKAKRYFNGAVLLKQHNLACVVSLMKKCLFVLITPVRTYHTYLHLPQQSVLLKDCPENLSRAV